MKFNSRLIATLIATVLLGSAGTAVSQEASLDSDQKKYSYAIGTKLAAQLQQQFGGDDSGVDMQALAAGLSDAISGSDLMMTAEEADQAIAAQQQEQLAAAAAKAGVAGERGTAFRDGNREKEGVTETESGLQYAVVDSGDEAGAMPGPDDTVVVHYRGTLIDGTEFDSSYSRGVPATFPLNGIIPGWIEVLQLMRPGDKWSVVIPPELAYGERGAGAQIGPNETLIFEIELIEVKKG
ncbi:MAG: FKBP-type peptidyl-prolyl cis-trans isomerase [bacterium]